MVEEYRSTNGLRMQKGTKLNWQMSPIYHGLEDPYLLTVSCGTWGDMYQLSYSENIVTLSNITLSDNSFVVKFAVNNIEEAENLALSFMKANNFELAPLYDKNYTDLKGVS
jgi:hypothetical protein